MVDIKMFMLACLTRRNADPSFGTEMAEWLGALDEVSIRKANQSPTRN